MTWAGVRRAAAGLVLAATGVVLASAGVVLAAAPVGATPVDPDVEPALAVAFPVEDVRGPVLSLSFPEANLDGSVTDFGDALVLSADVFFAYNDAALTERAAAEIASIVTKLEGRRVSRLTVTGHTDSEGADAHNLDLSRRRAESVRVALQPALKRVTISTAGRGESEPVAENDTAEGRAKNRRVVIQSQGG